MMAGSSDALNDVAPLRLRLNAINQILSELGFPEDAEDAALLAQLDAGIESPWLKIVVFGEFNVGKSTLINAIIGLGAVAVAYRPRLRTDERATTQTIDSASQAYIR